MNIDSKISYSDSQINEKINSAIIADNGKTELYSILFKNLAGILCTNCLSVVPCMDIERFHNNGGCCRNCEDKA